MKRVWMIFAAFLLCVGVLSAETESGVASNSGAQSLPGKNASFGFGLLNAAGDFGSQGIITSPWILNNHAAIRAGGFYLYRNGDGAKWIPYYGFKAGLVGGSFMSSADIRLYGEGGVIIIFPSSSFSSSTSVFGGYGHFGFEFFTASRSRYVVSYYIELGANGIYAEADKLAGSPGYLNGFETTVGLRFYP